MRKNLIYTIGGGLRIVCHHPFLLGVLGFLIYLYRSAPLVFSLLLYASPVLLCTAILLGTLLSFGELNLPEVEVDEKKTHDAVSLKFGASNESYLVEGYTKNGGNLVKNVVKKSIEEASTSAGEISDADGEKSLDDQKSWLENEPESKITEEENEELGVSRDEEKSEVLGEDDEYLEMDDTKSTDSFDSKRVYVDPVDSPPRSSWKRMDYDDEEEKEEQTEGGEAIDSGSNGDESSSPDASMTDIIPMLDELHPLLDEDGPQQVHSSHDCSHDGSTSESECSLSDEETDTPADLEVEDDENDNQEVEDDDNEEEKQEQSNPVITWTEEDQKNLMDLGSSEIERNQQLEKLLARRRARKHMSMVLEKDLIDFGSSDLALNIAPISTTRQNPFDLPSDSYTIPGSAPSILLPRRNPFDIPYPVEDKPNLRVDAFQEHFMTSSQSTVPPPFFQRVGTFNVGPSIFTGNGHERQDVNFRPYFIPEQAQESSYSQFQGHSNEVINSKASSVVERESINSVEDLEDRKETEPMSKTEQVSENVERGSQLSEEEGSSEFGEIKKRYVEVQLGDDKVHDEEGSGSQVAEAVEQRHSRDSSSSSSSEVSERVAGVAEEPGISTPPSESTDLNDVPHEEPVEPVYDSSPPEIRRNLSSSSLDSDVMDMDFLPVLIKQTVPVSRRESEDLDQELEEDEDEDEDEETPYTIEVPTESSSSHPVNEDDSRLKSDTCIREHDIVQRSDSEGALMEGNSNHQNESYQHKESKTSEDQNLDQPDNDKHTLVSDANLEEVSRETETSSIADYRYGKAISHSGNDLASSNKSVNEQPIDHHIEVQSTPNAQEESKEEVRNMNNLNIPEVPEFDHEISSYNSPSTPEFISIPCNDSSATTPPGLLFSEECTRGEATTSHLDVQTIIEDADGIKEIDEGVLSEIESDFNGSSLKGSKKRIDCGQESLSSAHETGNTSTREVDSIEVKETEHAMATVNEIGCTDLSEREFSESDVKESLHRMASKGELHPNENKTPHADFAVDQKLNLKEGNMEKQVETKSEDKSAEVEANEAGLSKDVKEPVLQETKTVAEENPNHRVETPEGSSTPAPDKEKTRSSDKSSSSSSSSSSDSGSD